MEKERDSLRLKVEKDDHKRKEVDLKKDEVESLRRKSRLLKDQLTTESLERDRLTTMLVCLRKECKNAVHRRDELLGASRQLALHIKDAVQDEEVQRRRTLTSQQSMSSEQ